MTNVFDVLNERGYVAQTTHEEELRKLLGSESVTFISVLTAQPTVCT